VTRSATVTVTSTPPAGGGYFSIGTGFVDVVPHQLIRSASDRVYAFVSNRPYTSVLKAYWTANPGLPTRTQDFGGSAQMTLASTPVSVSPAYDGSNTIHVTANLQNGSVVDVPFDVNTNTFGAATTLVTDSATVSGEYIGSSGLTSMFDLSGILHVVYWGTSGRIVHVSYAGSPLTRASNPFVIDNSGTDNHPSLAVSPSDNSVTVAWTSESVTPKRILARVRNASGAWGTIQNVSNPAVAVWTSTNAGINIDQGPSIVITADGVKHLAYIEDFDASGDYGSVHYVRDAGSGWVDQELTATYTHDPALAVGTGGVLYLIGHGHPLTSANACRSESDICVKTRNADGSWSASVLFASHSGNNSFDASPSVKWSVTGWNRPESVEFLFFQTPYDTPTLFYGRLP
jgi:hypothetical protein